MKTALNSFNKTVIAFGIVNCLTTLQFTSLAMAQGNDSSKMSKLPKPYEAIFEYATPSHLFAPQNGFLIRAGYKRSEAEIQLKGIEGKADIVGDSGRTDIGYGLGENIFFGVGMGYEANNTRADMAVAGQGSIQVANAEGATDPNIFVSGRMNFNSFSIIGGLDYLISTGASELQRKANFVSDATAKTGGAEITPSVSLFTNHKEEIIFGSSLSYKIKQLRKTNIKDQSGYVSEGKTKGGNETVLDLFIESPQSSMFSIGGVLSYKNIESKSQESLSTVDIKGSQLASASAFTNIQATKGISILPSLGYSYYINDKVGNEELRNQSFMSGALDLKIAF